MIYGQDEPMLFPVADLYDSGMMQMYINAAKELYNLNREDMKEFMKTYGDFMSPFANDIAWVDQHTRGRINAAMLYMLENGIDPLRSAEGRAIILNIINTTDRAGINLRKTNAALGEEYLKNRAKMIADGTYNEDYEKFMLQRLGLGDFNSFDSSKGSWTRTTPSNYQDLSQSTAGWIKDLEPEDMGLDPTGRYRIYGIPEEKLRAAVDPNIPGYLASDIGAYQYEVARRQLMSEGNPNPTDDEITGRLRSNIYGVANRKRTEKYEEDRYALNVAQTDQQIRAARVEKALQHQYREAEAESDLRRSMIEAGFDEDGDGKISKQERLNYSASAKAAAAAGGGKFGRGRGGTKDKKLSVFDKADAAFSSNKWGTYIPGNEFKENVEVDTDNPDAISIETASGTPALYTMDAKTAKSVIYRLNDSGKLQRLKFETYNDPSTGETPEKFEFEPSGRVYRWSATDNGDRFGHNYYVSGTLRYTYTNKAGDKKYVDIPGTYRMAVRESE